MRLDSQGVSHKKWGWQGRKTLTSRECYVKLQTLNTALITGSITHFLMERLYRINLQNRFNFPRILHIIPYDLTRE
jgi:hypothetical protein